MTRKRSAYRPRPVMTDPLSILRPADPAHRAMVMVRFLTALDAMACGQHPGEAEWRDLSDAINTVETLAMHQGKLVPAEVMPTVTAAIAAMVGAARRHQAGQRMGLTGEGLGALRGVLAIYQTCLDGLTEHEVAMAQAETQRRVNAILRSKGRADSVVML
jgi:hypothetical protein